VNLTLTPDELLSTTRAVRRRLDFDRPLDLKLVREFMVVTDPQKKAKLGDIYRKGWEIYSRSFRRQIPPEDKPRGEQSGAERIASSADYLAENIHRVPVMLIPCISGRADRAERNPTLTQASQFGSILPATWSFMLAARARGLGTCWTTLHLMHEEESAAVLGIPYASVTQAALIPVAHTLGGAFQPAPRKSLEDVVHIDGW
jgi:nitroreductase